MTEFSWLLVGHFVGDWLLQNDWMAVNKRKSLLNWAGPVHCIVYTLTTAGTLWLSGTATSCTSVCYANIIAIIFITHWIIDVTNLLDMWMQFYGQRSGLLFVRIMADQTLHLIILAMITVLYF